MIDFEWFGRIQKAHADFAENYPIAYFAARFGFAASTILSMHVFGYVHKLGIGMRPFVGLEVTADLLADILYFLISLVISFTLYFFLFSTVGRLFEYTQKYQKWMPMAAGILALYYALGKYLNFSFWSGSFGYASSSYFLFIPLVALIFAAVLRWRGKVGTEMLTSVLLVFLLSFSYVLGEVRAGTVPEYSWKQVVFLDDTRLDGYPLHRVSGGIIFRKRKFFSFDVGAVFIPYSSIKFITEPRRDSAGDQVLSLDYPSFIITAP